MGTKITNKARPQDLVTLLDNTLEFVHHHGKHRPYHILGVYCVNSYYKTKSNRNSPKFKANKWVSL
jgi:hypothetical protein